MNNGTSLLKIVNGLSRTLNIANQMIPLYKQVKPIIANSNKILSGIKTLNTTKPKNNNEINAQNNSNDNNYNDQQTIETPKTLSLPTFFQ